MSVSERVANNIEDCSILFLPLLLLPLPPSFGLAQNLFTMGVGDLLALLFGVYRSRIEYLGIAKDLIGGLGIAKDSQPHLVP
jgi:hypothetical protein